MSHRIAVKHLLPAKFQSYERIYHKTQQKVTLGNLESFKRLGIVGDFVEGTYLMMQHNISDNWVLAFTKPTQ